MKFPKPRFYRVGDRVQLCGAYDVIGYVREVRRRNHLPYFGCLVWCPPTFTGSDDHRWAVRMSA